ncbi:MAG: hypothetical protein ACXWB9_11025 [Flavisolibacter sp.]
MKFLFTIILALGFLVSGSTPVNENQVNPVVLESFHNSFKNAESVNWSENREFYKAEFLLNCQYVFAFYSKNGSHIATTRNMLFTELPVMLQTSLKELQKGYWISELFELSNEEGTKYYITLENADNKLILRSNKADWDLYQKKQKQ